MIQTIIICDVCKTEERGPYPKEVPGKYWKGEVAGGRWYKLAMYAAPAEGAATSDVTIDVCPECAEKLADQLGVDELPSLIEEEEQSSGGGLTITSPGWHDNSSAWTSYLTYNTNSSTFTTTPLNPA